MNTIKIYKPSWVFPIVITALIYIAALAMYHAEGNPNYLEAILLASIFSVPFFIFWAFGTHVKLIDKKMQSVSLFFDRSDVVSVEDIVSYEFKAAKRGGGTDVYISYVTDRQTKEMSLSPVTYSQTSLEDLACRLYELNSKIEFSQPFSDIIENKDNLDVRKSISKDYQSGEFVRVFLDLEGWKKMAFYAGTPLAIYFLVRLLT